MARFLVMIALLCFGVARATIAPNGTYSVLYSGYGGGGTSAGQACTNLANNYCGGVNKCSVLSSGMTGATSFSCSWKYNADTSIYTANGTVSGATCPANSTLNSGSCKCNNGYTDVGGSCQIPTSCVAGLSGGSSGDAAGSYCQDGCVTAATTVVTPKGSRSVWRLTGDKCNGESAAPPSAPSPPSSGASSPAGTGPCPGGADVCPPDSKSHSCPKGTFATDVGGSALCVSMQPMKTEAPNTNQTSGGTSSTGTSSKTTTSKTTTNPDGSTTTTETSSESKSGTDSKPNDMAGYCKENPGAAVCGDGGSWAGSCSGFTCGGDAVQCAQAQAAWKLTCALDADPASTAAQNGTKALNGQFINGDPKAGGEINVATGFNSSERYTGQCPANPSFTVWGKTVQIPLSEGCKWLSIMGNAAVAVCALAGARIALGS